MWNQSCDKKGECEAFPVSLLYTAILVIFALLYVGQYVHYLLYLQSAYPQQSVRSDYRTTKYYTHTILEFMTSKPTYLPVS